MKNYIDAELEIIEMESQDIITSSIDTDLDPDETPIHKKNK